MDALREHHESLRQRLATRAERALTRAGRDDLNALIALLEGELLSHARAEQRSFYPAVDEIVRQHGRATATMAIDHEAIEKRVRDIAVAIERLRLASDREERIEAKRILREALLRLEALLDVHMEKEERVYLPLLAAHLSEEEQRRLLAALETGEAGQGDEGTVVDARSIPPRIRHDEIFAAFARLPVGGSFVLVNDHDPRPLSYEFGKRHPHGYEWEELERGPLWRVRITRVKAG